MGDNMTPADVAAVVGNTDRNYGYPVFPYGGGYGNGGFGNNSDWIWIILLLAIFGGFGNNGNGGFGGFNDNYAWLSNGQKEIMQNTNEGFNTLHLSNQVEGVRDGINSLSNQLCNTGNDITNAVSNGFYNSEIAANNRQMANMQTSFDLSRQFADCCCENRLANCQTQNIIQNEGNATRFADANNTRDIITNATANTQAILDKLCQLELDGKSDKIHELELRLTEANLKNSQTEQNAFIAQGFANEVDALYNRLSNCPVPSTPVYGRTPIFTCNSGCGCNGTFGNTIV
jgi:hypothetical protein